MSLENSKKKEQVSLDIHLIHQGLTPSVKVRYVTSSSVLETVDFKANRSNDCVYEQEEAERRFISSPSPAHLTQNQVGKKWLILGLLSISSWKGFKGLVYNNVVQLFCSYGS